MTKYVLCANSHSPAIRSANLARSRLAKTGRFRVEEAAPSASLGYNRSIDATEEPILIFAHHDVFLPEGWETLLDARIRQIEAVDPNWAVLGSFGLGPDGTGWGPVWSSSLGQIVGRVPFAPMPATSLDELLIVIRRASGVRFDDAMPGWHMYGTDIAQTAISQGKGVYAGALPCIHNDAFHGALGEDFDLCYRYMQAKWRSSLPITTPVTRLTKTGLTRFKERREMRKSYAYRQALAIGTDHDVELLAAACGWSDLTGAGQWLAAYNAPHAVSDA